jgi:hypothetical protein
MKVLMRWLLVGVVVTMATRPVFAQDTTDIPPTDQSQDQPPAATDDTGVTQALVPDPAAVIAQWGPAPSIGSDADRAVAERWFREQNTLRSNWGVPTATRDPYLDWEAENLLRGRLGQSPLEPPQGLTKPLAAMRSSQRDQAVLSEPQFWTISDDLWLAWLGQIQSRANAFWQENHPGEPYYSRDVYLSIEQWKDVKFDRYRLMGIAGRVNALDGAPTDLLSGNKNQLERIASGSVEAYEPLVYPDNFVAVVGYDPWINPNGSLRQ